MWFILFLKSVFFGPLANSGRLNRVKVIHTVFYEAARVLIEGSTFTLRSINIQGRYTS